MPYTENPTSKAFGKGKNSIRFSFDWSGENVQRQAVSNLVFLGASFVFQAASVSGSAGFNLPAFRSIVLTQTYSTGTNAGSPGPLFLLLPDTGQVISVPVSGLESDQDAKDYESVIISACFPILSSAPTSIQFFKEADANTSKASGKLSVTLVDIDLTTYMTAGGFQFANQIGG